eukprot:SAG11_NODE_4360_length_1933_cov_1.985823_1_plen_75_part_00
MSCEIASRRWTQVIGHDCRCGASIQEFERGKTTVPLCGVRRALQIINVDRSGDCVLFNQLCTLPEPDESAIIHK